MTARRNALVAHMRLPRPTPPVKLLSGWRFEMGKDDGVSGTIYWQCRVCNKTIDEDEPSVSHYKSETARSCQNNLCMDCLNDLARRFPEPLLPQCPICGGFANRLGVGLHDGKIKLSDCGIAHNSVE